MPQTSLTTWLNKPKAVKESESSFSAGELAPVSADSAHPGQRPATEEKQNRTQGKSSENVSVAGSTRKPIPPNVEIRACKKEDIASLKNLTSLLLPIPYQDRFYREIIEDPLTNNITLVATWHDNPIAKDRDKGRLIGAIRCRLLPEFRSTIPQSESDDGPMLYLSTLVLLSPYRQHGIATQLLQILTQRAVNAYGVRSVGAHVWEANAEGLEWYRKRGFREVGREEDYYRKLNPSTAVVMQRKVSVMDFVGE
ncbi:putative gnat family protein [Zymoseptoria brevis]|uniref:Putative gnat family protein n=1 Tax=Zymoseptoria brevis TaxID=1047168 RepID=A0A0F4GY44_9PEZI|nr:putative gnat family protein [Zymoseptoria brevis]